MFAARTQTAFSLYGKPIEIDDDWNGEEGYFGE